jgi:thiamine biosynthesis lipoprotein
VRALRDVVAAALVLIALVLIFWQPARSPIVHTLDGYAFGSTWGVRFVGDPSVDRRAIRVVLEAELLSLDDALSSYRADGGLARLNAAPVGQWHPVPEQLARVIRFGVDLHAESGGAFDLTVKPLMTLWGFGAAAPGSAPPAPADIERARARLGSDRIDVSADDREIRKRAEVEIDVNGIAPGYIADVLSETLSARGIDDHLVEIGGELRTRGHRPDGSPWHLGIERPVAERGEIERVIAVSDAGVATSGDYRHFVEIGGKRYSHTIDPSTGRPIDHALASVTVVAPDALSADGYSTTLMVLGPEKGMTWADSRGLPCFMIVRTASGFEEHYNAAFAALIVE